MINKKGIISSVITPIDSKENVDEPGLKRVIDHVINIATVFMFYFHKRSKLNVFELWCILRKHLFMSSK